MTDVQLEDSGVYICTASDRQHPAVQRTVKVITGIIYNNFSQIFYIKFLEIFINSDSQYSII